MPPIVVRVLMLTTLIALSVPAGCAERDRVIPPTKEEPPTGAPVIDSLTIARVVLGTEESTELRVYARDPEKGKLAFAFRADGGDLTASADRATFTAPPAEGTVAITATVTDEDGETASEAVSVDVLNGTLLVASRGGVVAVRMDGTSFALNSRRGDVEVLGTRIFQSVSNGYRELDHQGNEIAVLRISDPTLFGTGFVMHPDGGFSIHDNRADSSYVAAANGELVAKVAMPNPSPNVLQNLDGFVEGNRLIVSETGARDVFEIDLTSYETKIFRTLPGTSLSAVNRHPDGTYYVTRAQSIERFTETGALEVVATTKNSNVVGLAPVQRSLFISINFEGAVYRVDRFTGKQTLLASGLNRPGDVEYIPARLEPAP